MRPLPGSRQQISPSRVAVLSAALVAATLVVFLHDVAAASGRARELTVFRDEWVGIGGATSLLFAAVSLHLARQQWAAGLYPLLSYNRRSRTESEYALVVPDGTKLWSIEVTNLGGVAIIDRVRYDIEMEGSPASRRDDVVFEEMLAVLEGETGFIDETDFVFVNWQGGMGILPGQVTRLCELPMQVARRIKKLDAHVFYKSRFGGLYKHVVSVIPARGLPRDPSEAAQERGV